MDSEPLMQTTGWPTVLTLAVVAGAITARSTAVIIGLLTLAIIGLGARISNLQTVLR